jgi:2-phospho-L-lactate/phosphoenolpyruvate guanylyltransferase
MEWVVLLPVKTATVAKSRLAPAFDDPAELVRLVEAMRRDTVTAVRDTPGIVGIVAVVDRFGAANGLGSGLDVVVQQAAGLNPALAEADAFASHRWPGAARIAVVGDLPALTPAALKEVLAAAEEAGRAFVPDLEGSGTTMLAVTRGPLDPRFGPGSAARHAADAVALAAAPEARHDVDLPGDLHPPVAAGFGPETRAVLAGRPGLADDAGW